MSTTPIFMRGDPCDLSMTYYLACAYSSSKGYVFIQNTPDTEYQNVTPVGGLLEVSDMYDDYPLIEFKIVMISDNVYTLQPTNSGLENYCLGINTSGYFDLVLFSNDTLVNITFTTPSSNSSFNIYNMGALYPSLNYSLIANYTSTTNTDGTVTTTKPQKFYLFNLTSSNSWEYYTVFPTLVNVMLIPTNNGQLATWQYDSDTSTGACYYSTDKTNIGIEWFNSWLTGTSVGCDTGGNVDESSNNCYFSTNASCLNGFLYGYCTDSSCGQCMGDTGITGEWCMYNIAGSSIPLFASSTPIVNYDNSSMIELDTSDDSDDSGSSGSSAGGASIGAVIVILLILILIIYLIYKASKKSTPPPPSSTSTQPDPYPGYPDPNATINETNPMPMY